MDRRIFIRKSLGIAGLGAAGIIVGTTIVTEINETIAEDYLNKFLTRSYGRVFNDGNGNLITANFRNATAVEMDILNRLKGNKIKQFLIERGIPFKINKFQ